MEMYYFTKEDVLFYYGGDKLFLKVVQNIFKSPQDFP